MKVLLTGEPKSGKTTLLESALDSIPHKQGFLTREILENGERTGFELVSSIGHTATLASIESTSPIRVSRYGVNVEELDTFMETLPPIDPNNLLYVDEIGQMELFSEEFKKLVEKYLDSANQYFGTITSIYHDAFTDKVLGRDDILLLEVSQNNREEIKEILDSLFANLPLQRNLSTEAQAKIRQMARDYVGHKQPIQLKKLFRNALVYLSDGNVKKTGENSYQVVGNHSNHDVKGEDGQWACDCDLFNGRGEYAGSPGECSHIQAAKLAAA
jgi:nucleoside-triphosphatase